ncbi:MAG: thiamine pyrophosphate-dependent enzyme, partial [Terriglobales bacterium]
MTAIHQSSSVATLERRNPEQERVFDVFRRWGYLQADLDPLGQHLHPLPFSDLDELTGPVADEARRIYCGTIGAEFMYITDPEQRRWIIERMESDPGAVDRERVLSLLLKSEVFEQTLQSRYLGTKRFSLEGVATLIPALDVALQCALEHGAVMGVIAMSHRGRLTVMTQIVGTRAADVFSRFEDVDPRSVLGGGDVKYHIGATGQYQAPNGATMGAHLVSNPSHLEAVDPVAMGRTRAKQTRLGEDGQAQVVEIAIHGDAAFAGQGIWAETMNMAELPAYTIGGSLHIIANNLVGFTTNPCDEQSSRFSSDLSKRNNVPVFHVNAEDPEAVVRVARMAMEFRYEFGRDVVIDLIGFRRHGHSEVDDPTITQPLRYAKIKDHPPVYESYGRKLGADVKHQVEQYQGELLDAQKEGAAATRQPQFHT